MVLKPTIAYFVVVFAAAFLFGALRVTLVAPQMGPLAAVALEVPLVLGLSWIVAGRVLGRWPLTTREAVAMGALAFALLMLAEFALAYTLSGQTPAAYAATFFTGPGALGLAGQIGFALMPTFRAYTSG